MTTRTAAALAALAGIAVVGCGDKYPASPPPAPPSAADRVLAAVDTLNVAIEALHADGGRVDYLSLLFFDFDTTIPPKAVIMLRRP